MLKGVLAFKVKLQNDVNKPLIAGGILQLNSIHSIKLVSPKAMSSQGGKGTQVCDPVVERALDATQRH